MSRTVHLAHASGTRGHHEHVGYRYQQWVGYEEEGLTAAQKAAAHEAFAAEFEALPPHLEPSEGWAEEMAYLCRLIAQRHRGEPVDEYIPRWERRRRAQDSEPDAPLRQVC